MGIWGGNVKLKSAAGGLARRQLWSKNEVNLRFAGVRAWRKGL
jgi:hypothetical protein